jgi:hypothetical protein
MMLVTESDNIRTGAALPEAKTANMLVELKLESIIYA